MTASIPAARSWVTRRLTGHGHGGVAELAALLVTELTTNVLRHTGSQRFTVRLDLTGAVEVAVHDHDPGAVPRIRQVGEDAEEGRGLALVEALSDGWGYRSTAHGKWVWFRFHPLAGT